MADISELDHTAQLLRVSWRKAHNYYRSFATVWFETRKNFDPEKYPGWTFSKWATLKAGMSEEFTMKQLKIFYRTLAEETRAAVNQRAVEIARDKRLAKAQAKAVRDAERAAKAAAKAPPPAKPKKVAPMPPRPAPAPVPQMRPQAQAQPDSNVVPMPTPLDRLAARIKSGLARAKAGRQEWIEGQIDLCTALAEARDQFPHNTAFGKWCEANGVGKDIIDHQNRAAAIAMGRDPVALRKCLEATERTALRYIYSNEFSSYVGT